MKVGIVGVGQTKFGELWDKSLRDLIVEAGIAAINDSGMEKNNIESLFIGSMSSGTFANQEHLGAFAADALSMNVPAVRCEGACASGSLALLSACNAVLSGKYNTAIVIGAEKMTDLRANETVASLALAEDSEWEASIGLTFAGLYALIAKAHMHKYGTTREQLAMVSVNNHKNAVGNKYAQFQQSITIDDVLNASVIAEPFGLLDCSPITDGAAAIVITNENIAKKFKNPIWITGSGHSSDTIALHSRTSITEMIATKAAAQRAFMESKISRNKIDLLEVHDCFTINELLAIEDLGFCEKGKCGKFVEDKKINLDGDLPVNTTGGLKACGHAVGATGIRQIIDISKQLRGTSHNQINGINNGLALNIGGSGATAVVHILSNDL